MWHELPSQILLALLTKNIGCVSGNSIQEIGGDLIFLAPDGLRTVAGTARIDDVELSSISRKNHKNKKCRYIKFEPAFFV